MFSLSAKRRLFQWAEACHLNGFARRTHGTSLGVLCYHGVIAQEKTGEREIYGNTVSTAEFERHLDYLGRQFHPISAEELCASLAADRHLPRHAVLVTFDDGYRNNATLAAPILRKKGIPAVFHLTTKYVNTQRILWPDEILLRILEYPERTFSSVAGRFELPLQSARAERLSAARTIKNHCKQVPASVREAVLDILRAKTPDRPSSYDAEAHDSWTGTRREGWHIKASRSARTR